MLANNILGELFLGEVWMQNFFLSPCWNFWAWICLKCQNCVFDMSISCHLIPAVFSTAVFYLIKSPSNREGEARGGCTVNSRHRNCHHSPTVTGSKMTGLTIWEQLVRETDRQWRCHSCSSLWARAHQMSWSVWYSHALCSAFGVIWVYNKLSYSVCFW